MMGIARLSVAISLTVMLISLSVIGGFKEALQEKLTGMDAHITVEPAGSYLALDSKALTRNEAFEQTVGTLDHFGTITPFVSRSGIIKKGGTMQGALLRGVGVGYDSLFYATHLVDGELPRIGDKERKKDILVSQTLANLLEVGIGD